MNMKKFFAVCVLALSVFAVSCDTSSVTGVAIVGDISLDITSTTTSLDNITGDVIVFGTATGNAYSLFSGVEVNGSSYSDANALAEALAGITTKEVLNGIFVIEGLSYNDSDISSANNGDGTVLFTVVGLDDFDCEWSIKVLVTCSADSVIDVDTLDVTNDTLIALDGSTVVYSGSTVITDAVATGTLTATVQSGETVTGSTIASTIAGAFSVSNTTSSSTIYSSTGTNLSSVSYVQADGFTTVSSAIVTVTLTAASDYIFSDGSSEVQVEITVDIVCAS